MGSTRQSAGRNGFDYPIGGAATRLSDSPPGPAAGDSEPLPALQINAAGGTPRRPYTGRVSFARRSAAGARWRLLAVIAPLVLLSCAQKPAMEPQTASPGESAPGPALSRYDLSRDEERGGHTLRKHVGRSDQQLRQRLETERGISAASTWTDRATAEETVAAALRAERGRMEAWTRRGQRRANLALHFDAGRVIGRSLVRGADESVPCTEAVIVLRADGDGFYVLTTYPELRQ